MSSSWRISPLSPVRDLGRMDYERCGALHNEIVERGWVGAGYSLESLDRTTYWDRWHDHSSWPAQQSHLDPSIVDFFKVAMVGSDSQSFFWTVDGLLGPDYPFDAPNNDISDDQNQYVLLYGTNLIARVSHPSGLVLDQHTFKAVFQPSIWDAETVMFDGVPWQPLEVILDSFLDMIDQGKLVAFPSGARPPPQVGRKQREGEPPWAMEPFTTADLRDTLSQWERLVEAIEARMPDGLIPLDLAIEHGSFHPDDDDFKMFPDRGLARQLLAAARRPRFQFIAPGLCCVDVAAEVQPFSNLGPNRYGDGRIRPVLLARGEDRVVESDRLHFRDAFAQTGEAIPAGLYLTETDPDRPYSWEDGCRLVLPYKIGDKGHARRSDGSFFANKYPPMIQPAAPASSNIEVHQHGHNPFIMHHDVQLKFVLQRWAELVESGYWEVDVNGVAGGIEKWREADTAEHWQKYQLPVHW